jgi:hypothetical protein
MWLMIYLGIENGKKIKAYGKDERWQMIENKSKTVALYVAMICLTIAYIFSIFCAGANPMIQLESQLVIEIYAEYIMFSMFAVTISKLLAARYYDKKY